MFLKDDLVLWSLLALIVLVTAVLGFILWVASRSETDAREKPRRQVKMRNDSLRASFRQAIELIEANIAPRAQRLTLPWVLVLNEGAEPAPLPLAQSGIAQALSSESTTAAAEQGISWNFFDKGIVINMMGALLGTPDSDDDTEKPWEEFLSLCRDYRPERPFDSLVLTVPVGLLMSHDPNARMELVRLAKLANRRLWMAQNRFAMRFSVYVVISGCERLPGFSPFARALPEGLRKTMLGWSSPFELAASYQENWVDQALNQVVKTVSDTTAELFALDLEGQSAPYFMLPGQVDSLRPQLQLYLDELMRASTYHEPFLMRGLYFTGDSGESAERALSLTRHASALSATNNMSETLAGRAFDAPPDTQAAGEALPQASRVPTMDALALHDASREQHALEPEPVFLRDLFEQKIFAEYGLARPSGSQLTSLPMLGRGTRWAAIIVLGGWATGLLTGSLILHKQSQALEQVLTQFQQRNDLNAKALREGEKLSQESLNQRTLSLLGVMSQMDGRRLWSLFMPGSWPVFDPLPYKLKTHIEQAFGDIAAATLQRGLQFKVSQLTGVAQDDSNGELIQGATCAAPAMPNTDNREPDTLGFQDLAEFASLLTFVTSTEQIDQAYQALLRLQDTNAQPNPQDLKLLVQVVTGTELVQVSQLSSQIFRSQTANVRRVKLQPAQEAMRCSFKLRMQQLQEQAFDNNNLLLAHNELSTQLKVLMDAVESGADAGDKLQAMTRLQQVLRSLDTLMTGSAGGSGWMKRPVFQPGAAWDQLLARISATSLLGVDMAQQSKLRFETVHKGFYIELQDLLSANPATEIVWDEKESRFVFAPALQNFKSSLNALMAEPYMAPSNNMTASELQMNAAYGIQWDRARLDEALGAQEQYKRFKTELLGRFPPGSQRAIDAIVKSRLANQVLQHLHAAMLTMHKSGSADLAAMEAERTRLIRLQQLLEDLGAKREEDNLRNLLASDALRRLQALDDVLQRTELYAIRGRSLAMWQGDRAPMLQALGLTDLSGLQPYLTQQVSRMEQLSKEADALLTMVPPGRSSHHLVQRWQGIGRDLERYRVKNPNSSLMSLETFMTAMAGDVDASNCTERLAGRTPSGRAADFFAERQGQLAMALSQRCTELRQTEQQTRWNAFASDFNRNLAGRPPFSQAGWSAEAPAVELEEMVTLLRSYERARPALVHQAQQNKANTSASPVWSRFLEQFDKTRLFLAPLVPAEEGAAIGYDVTVEFRANQGSEVQGNKVIDWTMDIGRQRLSLREPSKPLHWEPGQAIQLSLRLARDGKASPQPDPRQPGLSVDGKTVTLRFADAWSLFNLIARQRESESRPDGRSQLIKIEFPLQWEANAGDNLDSRARVYLRLTVSPTGKRTPLSWPGVLPTRAPELTKPMTP